MKRAASDALQEASGQARRPRWDDEKAKAFGKALNCGRKANLTDLNELREVFINDNVLDIPDDIHLIFPMACKFQAPHAHH